MLSLFYIHINHTHMLYTTSTLIDTHCNIHTCVFCGAEIWLAGSRKGRKWGWQDSWVVLTPDWQPSCTLTDREFKTVNSSLTRQFCIILFKISFFLLLRQCVEIKLNGMKNQMRELILWCILLVGMLTFQSLPLLFVSVSLFCLPTLTTILHPFLSCWVLSCIWSLLSSPVSLECFCWSLTFPEVLGRVSLCVCVCM